MSDVVRTINFPDGTRLEICLDPLPTNPRTEFDNASRMICKHRRYNLGDEHNYDFSLFSSVEELRQWVEAEEGEFAVYATLYLYDHSGISISTSRTCKWDSSCVGIVFITKETMRREWGDDADAIEKAQKCMESEIATYDSYLRGDVYGYRLLKPLLKCECCGQNQEPEEIDSCWGFIGSNIEENGIIDYLPEEHSNWYKEKNYT